jgi:hypothetical protein
MKYFVYFFCFFLFSCAPKQDYIQENYDIKLKVVSYNKADDTLSIEVFNTSSQDLWFDPWYFHTGRIYDQNGKPITTFIKEKYLDFHMPSFILLKSKAKEIVKYGYGGRYVLEEGKKYKVQYGYWNDKINEKDTTIKTFTGTINYTELLTVDR